MVVNPIVSGGGSSGNDLMKEVDWLEFSEAIVKPPAPKYNAGLIFLQNAKLYNGGVPIVLRLDIAALYPRTVYNVAMPDGGGSFSYSGNAADFSVEYNSNINPIIIYTIDGAGTPPTFADGWSARYFLLDL